MAHITAAQAQAWAEGTKLTITSLDTELEDQLAEEVIRQLQSADIDTSTWTNETTTPKLVRVIIAKLYVAWVYDRQYSEDIEQGSNYADRLKANANNLIAGLIAGIIELDPTTASAGQPVFYPTDASSAQLPTTDDLSLGPAAFSMGMRF
jgi:hypothetical protein